MKHRSLAVLLSAMIAACADQAAPADSQTPAVSQEEPGLLDLAAVSADSATKIALARVAGRVVEAEIEREDGVLVYTFDIAVAGESGLTEVLVDAQTGEIRAVEHEDDDDAMQDDDEDDDDDEHDDEHDGGRGN